MRFTHPGRPDGQNVIEDAAENLVPWLVRTGWVTDEDAGATSPVGAPVMSGDSSAAQMPGLDETGTPGMAAGKIPDGAASPDSEASDPNPDNEGTGPGQSEPGDGTTDELLRAELLAMTAEELKARAKDEHRTGYSRLSKDELVDLLLTAPER